METPAKIEFRGFEPSSSVRELVESYVKKFERRNNVVHSCRVVVRAPGMHHRLGEPYIVSIHLGLADGREVSVGGAANEADRRGADVAFAVTDSFHKAMRQLRDATRRLQAHTKQRGKMPATGK